MSIRRIDRQTDLPSKSTLSSGLVVSRRPVSTAGSRSEAGKAWVGKRGLERSSGEYVGATGVRAEGGNCDLPTVKLPGGIKITLSAWC